MSHKRAFLKKLGFGDCTFTLFVGVKVHLPLAFALFEGKIARGRCTFTPVSGVKVHLPKPPLLETTLLRHSKSDLKWLKINRHHLKVT